MSNNLGQAKGDAELTEHWQSVIKRNWEEDFKPRSSPGKDEKGSYVTEEYLARCASVPIRFFWAVKSPGRMCSPAEIRALT